MPWKAVTRSGTVYEYDGSLVRVHKDGKHIESIRPWMMRSFRPDFMEGWQSINWEAIQALAPIEEPVVGEHFLVSGRDSWRISTPVEAVLRIDEDDS